MTAADTGRTRYRGHVITRERMGHVNVTRATDGGWCGGWSTLAAARRAIDTVADRPRRIAYRTRPDGAWHLADTVDGWHLTVPTVGPWSMRAGG